MPLYPFQSDDGETRDFAFSMADAPAIGDVIEREGKRWTRLVSDFVHNEREFQPFASNTLPRNLEGWDKFDRRGRPIVRSKADAREIVSRSKGESESVHLEWD